MTVAAALRIQQLTYKRRSALTFALMSGAGVIETV